MILLNKTEKRVKKYLYVGHKEIFKKNIKLIQ